MAMVPGLYFTNLADNISEENFKTQLITVFGDVFAEAIEEGNLTIHFYKNGQHALVGGIFCEFDVMEKIAIRNKINGRDIIMRPDFGHERRENGEFVENLSGQEKRSLYERLGKTSRKVICIFNAKFNTEINISIFDIVETNSAKLNSGNFNIPAINMRCKVLRWIKNTEASNTIVYFATPLDSLQAIRKFNNALDKGEIKTLFIDNNGKASKSCGRNGLGVNGACLNFIDLDTKFKYIPFDEFDPTILNLNQTSKCWNCNNTYKLVGVSLNLNYVIGECSCHYTDIEVKDLVHEDDEKSKFAYHWPGEKHTRLALGQETNVTNPTHRNLIIYHFPMKSSYHDPLEFYRVVAPLVREEFCKYSETFIHDNKTEAKLIDWTELPSSSPKEAKKVEQEEKTTVVLIVELNKTKFWTPDNKSGIKKVHMKMMTAGTKAEDRTGKVITVRNVGDMVQLVVQIVFKDKARPIKGTFIPEIYPRPDKTKYTTTMKLLKKWVFQQEKNEENILLNVVLNNKAEYNFKIADYDIEAKPLVPSKRITLRQMYSDLNKEQREGVDNAMQYKFSLIQGPPGTGKTFLASHFVLTCAEEEEGKILVCASSNEATTGICQTILRLSRKHGLGIVPLRVLARSLEPDFNQNKDLNESEFSVTYLHDLVRQHPNYGQNEALHDVFTKLKNNRKDEIIKKDMTALEEHTRSIEREIMTKYKIIVMTIDAIMDKRGLSLCEETPFSTVIVDEGGQMSQVSQLNISLFNAKRIVIVGDQKQLPSYTCSFAAEMAGFGLSQMDWSEEERKRQMKPTFKWVTLLEQFRMETNIREIVSKLTYNGKLRDGDMIGKRPFQLPLTLGNVAYDKILSHQVVVFDHKYAERRIQTSFENYGESFQIIQFVKTFTSHDQIDPSQVVILTLYEAQRERIYNELSAADKELARQIKIVNVDGYQGKESDFVILSMVRSNKNKGIGFTSNPERINVMLSRARFRLLIFMNFTTYNDNSKLGLWSNLLPLLKEFGKRIDLMKFQIQPPNAELVS